MADQICPACGVERVDYEGPGQHLPNCPNCGVTDAPAMFYNIPDPPADVAKLIDELCEHRIGGVAARDDAYRLKLRRGLMDLIDARIEARVSGLELDDLV